MPSWRVSVEIPRLSLFLLDDGGGLRSSVYAGASTSAGVAFWQGSRLEIRENGPVLGVLDGGAVVWRTSVRFEEKRCRKALSKPRLRSVL